MELLKKFTEPELDQLPYKSYWINDRISCYIIFLKKQKGVLKIELSINSQISLKPRLSSLPVMRKGESSSE